VLAEAVAEIEAGSAPRMDRDLEELPRGGLARRAKASFGPESPAALVLAIVVARPSLTRGESWASSFPAGRAGGPAAGFRARPAALGRLKRNAGL